MKTKADVIAHVSEASGMAAGEVEKVLDAAFGYVRDSVKAAGGFTHPALGKLRAMERETSDGKKRTVYRYRPDAMVGRPKSAGGRGGKGKRAGGRKGVASEPVSD